MGMDIPTLVDITMERDLLKLSLKLIPRLIPGTDTMVDIMDILTMDMDTGVERRGKLKLNLKLLQLLIPKLIPGTDTIMDILMDITIMARDLLKLSLKLIPRLIPGMDTMVDTTDTPMVITGAESK